MEVGQIGARGCLSRLRNRGRGVCEDHVVTLGVGGRWPARQVGRVNVSRGPMAAVSGIAGFSCRGLT